MTKVIYLCLSHIYFFDLLPLKLIYFSPLPSQNLPKIYTQATRSGKLVLPTRQTDPISFSLASCEENHQNSNIINSLKISEIPLILNLTQNAHSQIIQTTFVAVPQVFSACPPSHVLHRSDHFSYSRAQSKRWSLRIQTLLSCPSIRPPTFYSHMVCHASFLVHKQFDSFNIRSQLRFLF